jgi:outer membrane receptor protein involved in Fe transport
MKFVSALSLRKSLTGSTKAGVLATSGATALLAALNFSVPAVAQEAGVEQVVVSSTRITRSGYDAPTPTTVVGADDIAKNAEPNVFTTINQLPELAGSAATTTGTTSSSAGTNGRSTLNLRSLGTNRTLVLIDGQRVIGVDTTGGTDISQFPQGLIQRVDIVTGGASASWGSDAVAGVVNFVMDKKFEGWKLNGSLGETTYGDDQQANVDATFGTSMFGDRGHFEISGEYAVNGGVKTPLGRRPWYKGWKLLQYPIAATPAGSPQYIASPNVADYLLSPGGIITGQGTSLSSAIVGTTFGPNGGASRFQYGSPMINPYMIGGDQRSDEGWGADLDTALTRGTAYARFSYDLTPDTNIWVTGQYAEVYTSNVAFYSTYKPGNLTIQCDNPFLPGGIATACGGAGHSVVYGTMNADLPSIQVQNTRTMRRYAVGGDGAFSLFGTDWTWDAHFTHGENDIINRNRNQTTTRFYNAAIDAVTGPGGTPICRDAAYRAIGCQAYNVIGTGVGDPSAASFFSGTAFLQTYLRQEAGSLSFNGSPFSLWAGPVSIAFGAEYREEAFNQNADCRSYSNCGMPTLLNPESNWFSGNFHPSKGSYHVSEAFLETVVPLLKDATWGDADLDVAGRATAYSASGQIETWKAGINYAPGFLDGVKFRALQSRDVRAPNLNDLYAAPSTPTGGVTDDLPGPTFGKTYIISNPTLANPNLTPEKAETTEVGVVFQPSWFPGFSTSVDYYRIHLKDAIGTISTQQVMDLCVIQNVQNLCQYITRDPATNVPTKVALAKINLASLTTDGFDFESSYVTQLSDWSSDIPGSLSIRSLASHVSKYITNPGIPGQPLIETAGQNSGSVALWRWMGVESWDTDDWNLTLTERWFSDGQISKSYIECQTNCPAPTSAIGTINNNHMDGAFYLDIGGSYNVYKTENGMLAQVYFKIDNVANLDPVPSPQFGSLPINNGTNPVLYDTLGRLFHLGFRVRN